MAWEQRRPLTTYLKEQRAVDARMRRVLLAAANSARRELAGLDPQGLRAAQLRLQQEQLRLWSQLGVIIEDGIISEASAVADMNSIFTNDLLRSLGVKANAEFRRQMAAQARNTIQQYLARERHGMTLSERVYKNGQLASGRIDNLINKHLLQGSSAREIAKDVARFINPSTPGGASYAAMRLGRTELNNAFHEAANETYRTNPFIRKVEWHLSASHPHADDCDNLVGEYDPGNVPDKPHPQCLCYTTPAVMTTKQVKAGLKSGRWDDYLDGVIAA